MVFRIAECTYGSMHRAFVPAYYPRAIPAFDSPRFFVSQMKIPSPRPSPVPFPLLTASSLTRVYL